MFYLFFHGQHGVLIKPHIIKKPVFYKYDYAQTRGIQIFIFELLE